MFAAAGELAGAGDTAGAQRLLEEAAGLPLDPMGRWITQRALEDDEAAANRQGKFLTPPFDPSLAAAPLRFMTVDCQMDHLFAVVRSWSANGSSRLV